LLIGDDIAINIVRIGPTAVRIGIEAPKATKIVREELVTEKRDNELVM
jgi:carbon storage regulator